MTQANAENQISNNEHERKTKDDKITLAKLKSAMFKINNRKAAGHSRITAKIKKHLGEKRNNVLLEIINTAWLKDRHH